MSASFTSTRHSELMDDAMYTIYQDGILFVAAAGNGELGGSCVRQGVQPHRSLPIRPPP